MLCNGQAVFLPCSQIWKHKRLPDFWLLIISIIHYSLATNLACQVAIWVLVLLNEHFLIAQSTISKTKITMSQPNKCFCITTFCGYFPHSYQRMALIVPQIVVVLVKRELSDGSVNQSRVRRLNLPQYPVKITASNALSCKTVKIQNLSIFRMK